MGVRGLYTHVEKLYKDQNLAHKTVNILKEIEDFRKINACRPVIIIDLWTMAHNMKISTKDIVVGFRLNVVKQQFAEFLNKLKVAGAELVFVFQKTQVYKSDFLERQEEAYANGFKVATADINLKNAVKILDEKIDKDWNFEFPVNLSVALALNQVASQFGQICGMNSVAHEIVPHSVNLAENLKAMAILSLDTYYFFYEGSWAFWSDADLDMKAMTVRQYNRPEVLHLLGVAREKQELFAALSELLRTKAANLKNSKSKRTRAPNFESVLAFVKDIKCPWTEKELISAVNMTFGFCPSDLIADIAKKNLKLNRNLSVEPSEKVEDVIELIKDDFANYAEEILVNSTIYISPVYFNLYIKGPSLKTQVHKFLAKTTGVLLKDKADKISRSIFVKTNSGSKIVLQKIEPIFPDFAVEPLQTLLSGDWSESDQWKLLLWITDFKLEVSELQSVPIELLVDVIVCVHLIKSKVMKLPEAMCLLQSIVEVHESDEPTNMYPLAVHKRVFYLGMWYQKVFFVLHSCLGAVGLKFFQGDIMFDGAHFHKLYAEKNARNAASGHAKTDSELLQKLLPITINKKVTRFRSKQRTGPSRLPSMALKNFANDDNITDKKHKKLHKAKTGKDLE